VEVNVLERHVCLAFAFEDGTDHGFMAANVSHPGERHKSLAAIFNKFLSSGWSVFLSHAL
jgi:hypothetical protein